MRKADRLFRGVSDDTTSYTFGNFIYGDLIDFIDGGTYIRMANYKNNATRVKSKTVGEFINKLDNKGNKIFEGDFDENHDVVGWCEKRNGWSLFAYDYPTKEFIHCHCYSCEGNFELEEALDEFEIKGNIHI